MRAPPESLNHRPSILAIHHGAGVSKKAKKGRNLSTKARQRQERAQDRAAAVMERTELKVSRSKGHARTVQTRRKAWEDINGQIPQTTASITKAEAGRDAERSGDEEEHKSEPGVPELDDEMGEAEGEVGAKTVAAEQHSNSPTPPQVLEDDEII